MGSLFTKSVRLDGSNEHVNIGNVAALDFERTNTFSVSAWVLLYSTSAQVIASKMTGSTTYRGWAFEIGSSGYLQFALYNDFTGGNRLAVRTTAVIPAGAVQGAYQSWHHVVVTYDGSSTAAGVKFYIDGVEITSKTTIFDTLSATIVGTAVAHLGRRDDGASPLYLNGNLAQVGIYNITLSGAQVTTIFNSWDPPDLTVTGPTGNLVGYWKIGDGDTYPTATDSSASGNNGTFTNTESTDIEAFSPGRNAMDVALSMAALTLPAETLFGAVIITPTPYFKMRALASPGPGYLTWVVPTTPDFVGTYAPGAIVPGSAVVADQWES